MSEAEEKAVEAAVAAVEAEQAVADKIAVVESVAAAEIERAQERVENAEAVAQSIMDATVMTELGRRVDGLATECAAWRAENEALKTEVAGLKATLTDLSSKLPPSLIIPPTEAPVSKGSPIPPASDKTEIVLADNPLSAEGEGQKGPETNKKRKRFAL